jgi:hypothetical protein
MPEFTPILAHGSLGWWDELIIFAVPVLVAILVVVWIAGRSGSKRAEDDQRE